MCGASMIRHVLALVATVVIYKFSYVPSMFFFIAASFWSTIYIATVCLVSGRKQAAALSSIELFAMIVNLIAAAQYYITKYGAGVASESQWFYAHYVDIMHKCYIAELCVIIIGVAYCGIGAVYRSWHNFNRDYKHIFSRLRIGNLDI